MHCVILPSIACPGLQYFSTLSHKWHDLKKRVILTKNEYFDYLHNFCLKYFSLLEEPGEI